MGFDIQRFPDGFDEELICAFIRFSLTKFKVLRWNKRTKSFFVELCQGSICGGVLQDPIQAVSCEHAFCQVKLSRRDETRSIDLFDHLDLYQRMVKSGTDLSDRSNTDRTRSTETSSSNSEEFAQPVGRKTN